MPPKYVKNRTVFSKEQLTILKKEFECNKFPTVSRKWELCDITELKYSVIANWFQNQRKVENKLNRLKACGPLVFIFPNRKSSL